MPRYVAQLAGLACPKCYRPVTFSVRHPSCGILYAWTSFAEYAAEVSAVVGHEGAHTPAGPKTVAMIPELIVRLS